MAYASTALSPRELFLSQTVASRSLFNWLLDTIMVSRQREAERDVARLLAGGKFTDEAEREIERCFLANPPRW
jgi:hypothetical protein